MRTTFACVTLACLAVAAYAAACDDGNAVTCDGCDAGVVAEGYVCPVTPGPCYRDGHETDELPVFDHAWPAPNALEFIFTAPSHDRTSYSTKFVHQTGGSPVDLTFDPWFDVDSCIKGSTGTWTLAQLIGHAGEIVDTSNPAWYVIRFRVRVEIQEKVWMYSDDDVAGGQLITRTVVSEFRLSLVIQRKVSVASRIHTLSNRVMYAIISKSELHVGTPAFVVFEIETLTALHTTITTDPAFFPVIGLIPGCVTFSGVNGLTYLGTVGGSAQRQRWRFTVLIGDAKAHCMFDPADGFTFAFNLVSDDPANPTIPEYVEVDFTSLESEDWCRVTDYALLLANQETFMDVARTIPSTYFFMDNYVYVRIALSYFGIDLSEPSQRATITRAVTWSPSAGWVDVIPHPALAYGLDPCPGYVCWHFIPSDTVYAAEPMTIVTSLAVGLPTTKRSALEAPNTTEVTSHIYFTNAAAPPSTNDTRNAKTGASKYWPVFAACGLVAGVALVAAVVAGVVAVKSRRRSSAPEQKNSAELSNVKTVA